MPIEFETVRLIRIFVSSPGDLTGERGVLSEVVDRINRTMGTRRVRLELVRWERDVVPQIGPPAQDVVNQQTPAYGIYLGIMANRFGTPTAQGGSGTEEEFRRALKQWGRLGSPWILFYFSRMPVDPTTLDLEQLVRVRRFEEELRSSGLSATYLSVRGTDEAFFEKVEIHLRQLIERDLTSPGAGDHAAPETGSPSVPAAYRSWLQSQCAEVELLGLRLKQGQAVRLSTVYVPLTVPGDQGLAAEDPRRRAGRRPRGADDEQKPELLLDLLGRKSLYVAGAPGSGKSTFCRWVAWLTCEGEIPSHPVPPPDGWAETFPVAFRDRLPLLLRLRELWTELPARPVAGTLTQAELEATLERWVEKQPGGLRWPLVRQHLATGSALILLDGVDEVPLSRGEGRDVWQPRALLLGGLAAAIPRWVAQGNRVLVTSRPYGLTDAEARRLAIDRVTLEPLARELQELLVRRWFRVLADDTESGEATAADMLAHVAERDWLEPLRTSPMLLTAMCVVYSEGKRLPQDRHDLYARIVDNVLHNRFPGDPVVIAAARGRLSVIAHGMHTGAGLGESRVTPEAEATAAEIDRMIQVYRDQSAFTEPEYVGAVEAREQLLSQTGLLLPRGDGRAGFYHFSIQEFLAAQRVLDVDDGRLPELFRERARNPEWRNTLSFVFGALLARGVSPDRGVHLLADLIASCGNDALGLAVVASDCLEILLGRGIRLQAAVEERFRRICLSAIEREVPVRERWQLGVTLGRIGDPRIVTDLRDPAAYVEIAAGTYRIGEERRPYPIERPFLIARCPVTNSQYRLFMDEGGYEDGRAKESQWWSADGRAWLSQLRAREPVVWRVGRWNAPNQPVVGVSFWEAEAFCCWAGGRLPGEWEWEAAARGPEGWKYPWGDEWRDGICNSAEANLEVTSPVGIFPRSRSKANDLEDMAGNVWEWCDDLFDPRDKDFGRVLRGGSWWGEPGDARTTNRFTYSPPNSRGYFIGFRVVVGDAGTRLHP